MRKVRGLLIVGLVAAAALTGRAQSNEERTASREVVRKRGDAVIMVLATVKLHINQGGREQPVDQATQANATVLDNTGLAVMSLSTLQPDGAIERTLSSRVGPGTKVEVTSEATDIRMRFGEKEVPAKMVLKDEDLDLAFIRPVDALAAPVPFVDAVSSKPNMLDSLLVLQRTSETTGWLTAAAFGQVQLIIDKPRTYYLVSFPSVGGGGLGAPMFDTAGRFVGVIVLRTTGQRGTGTPGVLPADDIREAAKQAK
jgi:S1-C subfamily serine protease